MQSRAVQFGNVHVLQRRGNDLAALHCSNPSSSTESASCAATASCSTSSKGTIPATRRAPGCS